MALATVACRDEARTTLPGGTVNALEIANLRAFARLYGVVRWFHPSDAAAAIDWDRFAIDGAHRVADAPDRAALRARLSALFAPIAPTVHIVATGEAFPDEPALRAAAAMTTDTTSWQHRGYGDSTLAAGGYASKRRHRPRMMAVPGALFLALSQSIDAAPYRGLPFRFRGRLRAASHGKARLWLRVDRHGGSGFFDNMERRPVTGNAWTDVEIAGTVDPDATQIVIGLLMMGVGATWYDDLSLSVKAPDGTWSPIALRDAGFEDAAPLDSWRPGTGRAGQSASPASIDGWAAIVDHEHPASGAASLRLEPMTRPVTEELFDAAPRPGETVDVDLGDGLRARVPISLYLRAGRTVGDDPASALRSQASPAAASSGFDVLAGVADVIVVWNVLRHFWPYGNLHPIDWSAELDHALADALDDRNVDDHVATLERLSAAAPDGHASTVCPGEADRAVPPFSLDLVEGRIVVTASMDRAIERGDVILSVDGEPAAQLLAREEARISGSPQWRHVRGLRRLGGGPTGSRLALTVHRGDRDLELTAARVDSRVSEPPIYPAIQRFDDGIYYIDLSRASMSELDEIMDPLAVAPGVVFDLRERPADNDQVLSHLLARPDTADRWMAIPLIVRPDSASSPAAWAREGWNLPVLPPHIRGKIAFVTGPDAISYSESVMGLVEHHHLGEIVGAATAGSNGDIAQISGPTGCDTTFTGRLVTRPDGSRHYLVGIQPTIPAPRTIAGVIAGRDEVVEKALAYLRTGAR